MGGADIPWEDRHTQALTRGMIRTLLSSRSSFYHLPGLDGEVDGHGGNRISQKVVQQCEKMAREVGLDPKIVKEEIKKKAESSSKPKARAKSGGGSTTKKRKVKDEDEKTTGSD